MRHSMARSLRPRHIGSWSKAVSAANNGLNVDLFTYNTSDCMVDAGAEVLALRELDWGEKCSVGGYCLAGRVQGCTANQFSAAGGAGIE